MKISGRRQRQDPVVSPEREAGGIKVEVIRHVTKSLIESRNDFCSRALNCLRCCTSASLSPDRSIVVFSS
jgi:hypothetical protein